MGDEELLIQGGYRGARIVTGDAFTIAAVAGFVAAIAHAVVVRDHLAHWWGYGLFFASVAATQALAAVTLYRRPGRKLLAAVAIGDLGLIALYVISRTLGTPFVGPHAGHTEPLGVVDLIAKAAEGVQLAVILFALRRPMQIPRRGVGGRRFGLVAIAAVAAVAIAVPGGAAHQQRASSPILIFAADQIPNPPDPHDVHAEETPAPPITEETPSDEEPPPPCTPRAAPGDPDSVGSSAVLYSHDGDLWLAAPPDGKARRLTTDEGNCWETSSAFRDADTITFAADSAIYDLELRTGRLTRLVEELGVADLAWNLDGSILAYLNWAMELRLYSPSSGDVKTARAFGEAMGRCGDMSDETSVAWSPDGRSLLVVSTALDNTQGTMFVINREGKNLVAPRFGTHARWAQDSKTILYRGFDAPMRWYSLDLETGRSTVVAMEAGTHHAAVSPDGRYIAYSDDADRPTLYLYDLEKGTERVLTRGYGAPVWLSSNELAVTKTMPCDENCMMEHGWMGSGETAAFDLSGNLTRMLSMKTTMDASVIVPPPIQRAPEPPSPSPTPPSPSPTPTESSNALPLPTESPTPSPKPSETPAPDTSSSPAASS